MIANDHIINANYELAMACADCETSMSGEEFNRLEKNLDDAQNIITLVRSFGRSAYDRYLGVDFNRETV